MSSSNMTLAHRPWVSNRTAQDVLVYTHYSSPIVLLAFFLVAFTAHSIITASDSAVAAPSDLQTGPGGKPLPQKKKGRPKPNALDFSPARKSLFNWLSVGAIATLVSNAGVVILHTILGRKDNWWCGKSVAVGPRHAFHIQYACTNCTMQDLRRCVLLRV